MEGMIPIEEFKNDKELEKLKVGSQIDVYLERIESFKGEIIISRDKARKMRAWKKMEKVFETQEEMTGYITGKVKGGFVTTDARRKERKKYGLKKARKASQFSKR